MLYCFQAYNYVKAADEICPTIQFSDIQYLELRRRSLAVFGALLRDRLVPLVPAQSERAIASQGRSNRERACTAANVQKALAISRFRQTCLKPKPAIQNMRIPMNKRRGKSDELHERGFIHQLELCR